MILKIWGRLFGDFYKSQTTNFRRKKEGFRLHVPFQIANKNGPRVIAR
jgi:hypothetical protein